MKLYPYLWAPWYPSLMVFPCITAADSSTLLISEVIFLTYVIFFISLSTMNIYTTCHSSCSLFNFINGINVFFNLLFSFNFIVLRYCFTVYCMIYQNFSIIVERRLACLYCCYYKQHLPMQGPMVHICSNLLHNNTTFYRDFN